MADEFRVPDDYLRRFKVVVIGPHAAGVDSGPVLVQALWATVERVEFVTPAGEPLAVVPI